MAQSLEQYVREAEQAYQPSTNAIQSQIDALTGQLQNTNDQINRNYAQQQSQLNRSKNIAASEASMQAAGSGGSFGGAANIANRKYYQQSFVPAQTQLQTNQANELSSARQASEDNRLSLQSQLANLQSQANSQALAQYYADLEAERERAAAAAQQNAYYQYLMDAANSASNSGSGYSLSGTRNEYGGFDWTDASGNKHRAATVANAAGGDFNSNLYSVLQAAANQGDNYSANVLNELASGYRFAPNTTGQSTGNAWYDTLGIVKTYTPNTSSNTSTARRTTTVNSRYGLGTNRSYYNG